MNVLSAGPVIAGGGQLERAFASFQFDDVLHAALAPGAFADDHGPLVVLQAGRQDFAGAGAIVVDQHDHGKALEGAVLLGLPDPLRRIASLGADDLAVGDEQVGHLDGRAQQPARIEAQVENQPLEAFLLELLQDPLGVRGRVAAECGDADVADVLVGVEHEVPAIVALARLAQHGVDVHQFAGDGHRFLFARTGVSNGERDFGVGVSLEPLDGFVDLNAFGALAVDFQDDVARFESRPIGRRAEQRADDLQLPVLDADLNADPAERMFDVALESADVVGADVVGIGIELAQYAFDGRFHQLAPADVLDVVALDLIERVGKDLIQLEVAFGALFRFLGPRRARGDRQCQNQQDGESATTFHRLASGSRGFSGGR